MDEEDFKALIAKVEAELEEIGALEILDPAHYRDAQNAREHVIEILLAFDRYLAVRDAGTLWRAIKDINDVLADEGDRVTRAGRIVDVTFVVSANSRDEGISLREAPELGALREDIRVLVSKLESDRTTPREL